MNSREEIFDTLKRLMADMFEIDPEKIGLDATLNRDLDIDSIDAVDLMVRLQEITGRRVKPEEFKNVRTVGDVVDTLYRMSGRTA